MTTRYDPRWPHQRRDHAPHEGDALTFPRVVRQEWTFDARYPRPVLRQLRYSPDDRVAVWFYWPPQIHP